MLPKRFNLGSKEVLLPFNLAANNATNLSHVVILSNYGHCLGELCNLALLEMVMGLINTFLLLTQCMLYNNGCRLQDAKLIIKIRW